MFDKYFTFLLFSISIILISKSFCNAQGSDSWKIPQEAPLLTKWAKDVSPQNSLPEYPRPQMVRHDWMNLNGLWQYSVAKEGEKPPIGKNLKGTILVPYPIESALSGVMKTADRLWYRRTFKIPEEWNDKRIILHFGAVDWETEIYINGKKIGEHRGGYDPFSFEITSSLMKGKEQELVVGVFDPTDAGDQPRGKQVRNPHGIWYTPTTGIWQTVWLEPVPDHYIYDLIITPNVDEKSLKLKVITKDTDEIRATAFIGQRIVATCEGKSGSDLSLPLDTVILWSPSNPFLYDLKIELIHNGKVHDEVASYFGMRKIHIRKDALGIRRIMLNNKFLMQVGLLDQGFWPDGIYTAPTDEALKYDIEITKKLGFNMTRKHVKVEPERWYYWADKLGLLVWQDMPSGNNKTPESKKHFEKELEHLIQTHKNHPSIIMWVVFNEGWGQFETERLTEWVKDLDPTRLVNNASGWTDKNAGDVMDIHNYPKPLSPKAEPKRAIVLGEFGGLGLAIPNHTWKKEHWGYKGMQDNEQLTSTYETFLKKVYEYKDNPGLSAAVYTQITDVEVECNGLLTYDRAIIKPDLNRISLANQGDFSKLPPEPYQKVFLPTSRDNGQKWRYTFEPPEGNWQNPEYDDSHWKTGVGGFGNKGTPGSVVRTEWLSENIWLRQECVLKSIPEKGLYLFVHHDEDAEVYLNGVLALRVEGWTSDYEQYEIFPEAKKALKPGKNVIAIHCKQTDGGQYIDAGIVHLIDPETIIKSDQKYPVFMGNISIIKEITAKNYGSLYTGNRYPLVPSPFMKLPIGSIKPRGWLRNMLELEKNGMTGKLKEISPWLNWEKSAWANKQGEGERGWEELPYWLKGYGDLGYILNDKEIINEARKWIEMTFESQTPDGWFGPRSLQTSLQGQPDLWPHMVMLNVLQSYYEYSNDNRVINLMTEYFRWQNKLPANSFGAGYWPKLRMGDNIESVHWLYNRTGEKWLLDLSKKMHENMARWDEDVINGHNVNIAQGFREPAVYYVQSSNIRDLQAAERNYRRVKGIYGQFPGGGFASDENCRFGFTDPRQGFETCGFVEFMHSFELLTKISGNPIWSDRCEEIAFNSLPAAMTPDLKGLHYLTCANQIQLDKGNKAPAVENGGTMFSYSPFEVYRCCQHNVSHGWPYYAEELWLATSDNGLCASLYAASEVNAKVGDGTAVKIIEETNYPFSETIKFKISTKKNVEFPLYLRIPGWCDDPALLINKESVNIGALPSSYIKITRTWADGDEIELQLKMKVSVHVWKDNKNAVSVNYGPLTFSLKISERWVQYGQNKKLPEWEVFPTSPWNYGLIIDETNPSKSFDVVRKDGPLPSQPFTPENSPILIKAQGRKIPAWQMDHLGLVGLLQESPAFSDEPIETLTLIPMGATRLRISSFPTVSNSQEANKWTVPSKPKAIEHEISYSYLYKYDFKEAVADGIEPVSSNDERIPRFTWWNHRGTTEWVQYDFPSQIRVSSVSVYWYDDTGDGECRVPKSWQLFYRKDDSWIAVSAETEFGTEVDRYNVVKFKPIETNSLKLEVQLQPNFSAGILEWKIGE